MPNYYTGINPVFNESEDTVTTVYTVQKFPLGMKRERDGQIYRFVKYDNGTGNLAALAGGVCYIKAPATDVNTVTMDVSDTHVNQAYGIFVSVPADNGYCWVLRRGYYAAVLTNGDDDIAAGDALIGVGDGTVNSTAAATAPTHKVVGWASAADNDGANTVAAYITLE